MPDRAGQIESICFLSARIHSQCVEFAMNSSPESLLVARALRDFRARVCLRARGEPLSISRTAYPPRKIVREEGTERERERERERGGGSRVDRIINHALSRGQATACSSRSDEFIAELEGH